MSLLVSLLNSFNISLASPLIFDSIVLVNVLVVIKIRLNSIRLLILGVGWLFSINVLACINVFALALGIKQLATILSVVLSLPNNLGINNTNEVSKAPNKAQIPH